MKQILFICMAVIAAVSAQAQLPQFAGWAASFNTFRLQETKFSIHLDVQARSTDKLEHFQTTIVRPGLNYQVRKNMTVSAGYGLVHNSRSLNSVTDMIAEHRIWEQFIVHHPLGFVPIQHRFRVEQRFIGRLALKDALLEKDGYDVAHRIRYFVRGIIPFNGKRTFTQGVFGAVQNELFLHFANLSVVNGKGFDQNRAYLATGYRFSSKFDLEAGYMNQYISGSGSAFTNVHIAQVAAYWRL